MKNYIIVILVILLSPCRMLAAGGQGERRVVHYNTRDGLSGVNIGGGVQDRNGLLWFATWNGLNCYDGYDFHRVHIMPGDRVSISTNRIRDILLSDEGNILCRTDEDIYEYDLHTYSFKDVEAQRKDSLRHRMGRMWHGFHDAQGNLWTAAGVGLNKSVSLSHPAGLLEGTAGLHARAFLLDRDSVLWVGTRTDRCVRKYGLDGRLLDVIQLDYAPYCIFQTSAGDVWIGCKPGALIRNGGTSISDDAVYDIQEDRLGRLWIATFGGGVKCCENPKDATPVLSTAIGGYKVRKLLITPMDNIVAATTDGLLIGHIGEADSRKEGWRVIRRDGNDPCSLCSNATISLARDSRGNIFIATESSGVDMINEKELFADRPAFTHFNISNSALSAGVINSITMDSDSLLMIVGGDNVMAFNPLNGHGQSLSRTFWGDTCFFSETTPLKLHDGTWIFGAEEGALTAASDSVYGRGYVPPVIFTTFVMDGGRDAFSPTSGGSMELPLGIRNLTVRFAAIDYTDNEDILYRKRMDGSPWTGADHTRSVTLFNMTPGIHRLEVQSTDRYGRWVDNVAVLEIEVPPYWYEMWWAHALLAVAVIAAVIGCIYTIFYIRNVNRNRRELLEKYMALIRERDMAEEKIGREDKYEMPPLNARQTPEDVAFLDRVRRYVEDNLDNAEANVDDMALAAAASRSTLNRRLRAQLGITAAQLLIEARMQRARQLLTCEDAGKYSISEIADMCGYGDVHYFQRVFKKRFGMNPSDFRDCR